MTGIAKPEDYDPFVASPTQVSMFELCSRKWAWKYLDGIEGEENKWATFGTNTHGHLERWLALRVPPLDNTPEQKLAQVMLKHLPPPQAVVPSDVEIELSLRLSGLYFIGKIDLWMPNGYDEVPMPIVYDHKTTGDLQWALTPELMKQDIQATIYAAWAMLKTRKEQVAVQWTYGVRKPPRAHPVRAVLTGRDIQDRLGLTLVSAKKMHDLYHSEKKALDVVYDASACEAYGGCPYRAHCNLTDEERMDAIMAQGQEKQMTIQERLKARSAAASKGTNPPVVEVPAAEKTTATAEAPSSDKVNNLLSRMRNRVAAGTPTTTETAPSAPAPSEPAEVPKRGRGRPRTVSTQEPGSLLSPPPAPVQAEPVVQKGPDERWLSLACAALSGGATAEEASVSAAKLSVEYTELFGE